MIRIGTRTRLLFALSALTPLSILIVTLEMKFPHNAYSPPSRGFVLLYLPYQDLLEALFFLGVAAFLFCFFSLIRDNRSPRRTQWLRR